MNDLGRPGHGTLGAFLRSHREAAGLTQQELARQAGISLVALRDLEQGRTVRPRRQSLLKLAVALRLERAVLGLLALHAGTRLQRSPTANGPRAE
jgi:transcriptional regulator with XRE-family HTH domain